MTFSVTCPGCRKTLKTTEKHIGKVAKCPGCGASVTIAPPVPPPSDSDVEFAETPPTTTVAPTAARVPPKPKDAFRRGMQRHVGAPTLGIITIAALLIGYFAGREHLKYELRSAFAQAGNELKKGLQNAFSPPDDPPAAADPAATLLEPWARAANLAAARAAAQAKWKEIHDVSDTQFRELIDNFIARKHPSFAGSRNPPAQLGVAKMAAELHMTEWWEEAKDKTPAQLNKLYPPMQPHEWYRAEWMGAAHELLPFLYPGSRELKQEYSFETNPGRHYLTLNVMIRTEPGLPIKALHGHLAFVKDERIIYEDQIAEKPDVSFTDSCFVHLKINQYDDDDETHRTLRYAKDNELTPVFTVSKVVLADGIEKTF